MNKLNAKLQDRLNGMIEIAQRNIDTLASNLTSGDKGDPYQVLEWSGQAFQAAADLRVCRQLLAPLQAETVDAEALLAELQKRIVQKASYATNKSTSPLANLMAEAELQCMAHIIDRMGWV